jgi:small multidrug resistance pump
LPATRTEIEPSFRRPSWAVWSLRLASIQCLFWGPFIILTPEISGRVYGFGKPVTDVFLWQGSGLIIFLFGIGYLIASGDPFRHWVMVLIGLLAKVLGPVGMLWSVLTGQVSSDVLRLIPLHDLLWWIPFTMIVLLRNSHSDAALRTESDR